MNGVTLEILTRQLETLKVAVTEGNRYKAERDDLEKRVVAVEELTRNQTRPIYFLDALADAIPRDLWITGTSERDRIFHFNGTAYSSTAVAGLSSSKRLGDIEVLRRVRKHPNAHFDKSPKTLGRTS